MIRSHSAALAAALAAPLMLTAGAALADAVKVQAQLVANAEVPPNTSKGKGELTGTFDPESRKLTYEVTYSDLTGRGYAAGGPGRTTGTDARSRGPAANSPAPGSLCDTATSLPPRAAHQTIPTSDPDFKERS